MEQQERDGVATRLPEPAALADKPAEVPSKHLVPVFDVQNVSIFYGSFRAVTDVSLTIYENEITAFIGSSGSGKSTVLRAFNRMNDLVPSAHMDGVIDYRGESLYAPDVSPVAVRRRIGMVFQKPNPFPKSIYENVAYGPRINGIRKKSQLDEIVESSLRKAALWDEVKNRLGASGLGLSGGQAQRLCRIEDLMHELKSQYTIVIVTHNMQQATRVSDRTAFFSVLVNPDSDTRTGVLVEYGPTQQIFENPHDRRTEAYVTGRIG
ncbi:MAG: phosphate ABC transporter ATP-binding protein [Trebonia sp.]